MEKIRHLIRSITRNLDKYNEKYIKVKFNSDEKFSLRKVMEISETIIVVRAF